jgi:hypothetical protein
LKIMKKFGKQIIVVDNGFVFLGDCELDSQWLKILNGVNLRVWGTTKGLRELCHGPTKDTVSDPCPTLIVPIGRVVFFMEVLEGW